MSDLKNFDQESKVNIEKMAKDSAVKDISQKWIDVTGPHKYVYNWKWFGLPIIQLPPDVVAMQEIIWKVKPTKIIETGIARGGSLLFNASQLLMLDLCEKGYASIKDCKRKCIGIDIDIRDHNKRAICNHPLSPVIELVQGSSTDDSTVERVKEIIHAEDTVLVILDSNHTHEHVYEELLKYSSMVSVNSYIVVQDTGIEYAPEDLFANRDWGIGDNPLTAVRAFLQENDVFAIDKEINDKLLITSSPDGWLKRLS